MIFQFFTQLENEEITCIRSLYCSGSLNKDISKSIVFSS